MDHNRQSALSQDELDKLMDTVVHFDMNELVRVTNKAIERGNHTREVGKSALIQLSPADAEAILYSCEFIAAAPRSGPAEKFPIPMQLLEESDEE